MNSKSILFFVSLSLFLNSIAETKKRDLPNPVPGAAHFLKLYPNSDLNKDGILTAKEKDDYCISLTCKTLGSDYIYEQKMVPMRDGIKLATGIFRPKKAGKYPVMLTRTSYGIQAASLHEAGQFVNKNIIFIAQDLRGDGESEGKGTLDPMSFDNEINDGYDTVAWIRKQTFSNGKVGMAGQSGHGFAAYMGYLSKPPGLNSIFTTISGGNAYLYWGYHNGVRREMINWFANRNTHIPQWPKPTIRLFDKNAYIRKIAAAKNNPTIFIAKTGWYDIFAESALDYFNSFADNGKIFLQVDASGHGRMAGRQFPHKVIPKEWQIPDLVDSTINPEKYNTQKSRIVYYLMGDVIDPKAPGNTYKIATTWPVPHTPTFLYMHSNGALSQSKPVANYSSLSFKYDPRNPVSSEGGDVFIHKGVGPKDQRVLKNRKDILRFTSEPLKEPMEITGKVLAELFVKTDVEDTTFTAKLIDIYPDGYEAIVRDSIIMGRFHEGFNKESRMEKGKVYKLKMDMWSTALVINKGHRLAVHISSSNSPKYEVHPNTFEPVTSFAKVPIATNTIMLSKDNPSKIIMPVIK